MDVLSTKVWVLSVVCEEVAWTEKQELYSVCYPGNRGREKHIYSSYLKFLLWRDLWGSFTVGQVQERCLLWAFIVSVWGVSFPFAFPWEIHLLVSLRWFGPHLLSFPGPSLLLPHSLSQERTMCLSLAEHSQSAGYRDQMRGVFRTLDVSILFP